MKRKGWPIWLLRDVPAFLGVMLSFWTLVIHVISSGRRHARGQRIRRSFYDMFPALVAHAEARLVFALTRQAYRRLGWNHRLVKFTLIPSTDTWDEAMERYANYSRAFRNMESVVDAYIDDIRQRYAISVRDLVAHGATDAQFVRAAHHALKPARAASPLALILSSARPTQDARGHAHARGPPLSPIFPQSNSTYLAGLTCEIALPCLFH